MGLVFNETLETFLVYNVFSSSLEHLGADLILQSHRKFIPLAGVLRDGVLLLRPWNANVHQNKADNLSSEISKLELRYEYHLSDDGYMALSNNNLYMKFIASNLIEFVTYDSSLIPEMKFKILSDRKSFNMFFSNRPYKIHTIDIPATGRLLNFERSELYGKVGFILNSTRVLSTDWAVISKSRTLLQPNSIHLQRYSQKSIGSVNLIWPKPKKTKAFETACLIGGYYNFCHHLLDYTINYFAVKEMLSGDIPLIVAKRKFRFQQQISSVFGMDNNCIELDDLEIIHVDRLIIPNKIMLGDGYISDFKGLYRCIEHLSKCVDTDKMKNHPKRIYISRAKANVRRPHNEKELIKLLKDYNFATVILEELDFKSQVSLFLEAESVVSLHGAGMSHIVFAPPSCSVIEIVVEGWQPEIFANIASSKKQNFWRSRARGSHNDAEIYVDLAELKALMRRIF